MISGEMCEDGVIGEIMSEEKRRSQISTFTFL